MKHLQHKTAIITGAGSGLGRAMALQFAQAGFMVAVTDNNLEAAEETLSSDNFPSGSFAMQTDVTDENDWQKLIDKVQSDWPGLGILINNAGVASAGLMEEEKPDRWQWLFEINVFGVARGCRYCLPLLKQQNSGHIVNIASFAALAGGPALSNYGASKAAVYSLSESLHNELAATNIKVTVACPAFIRTNLIDSMQHSDASHVKRAKRWMETSGYSVDDFAKKVLSAVNKQQFLLLIHTNTKWLWRLKRWLPGMYYQFVQQSVRKSQRSRK